MFLSINFYFQYLCIDKDYKILYYTLGIAVSSYHLQNGHEYYHAY